MRGLSISAAAPAGCGAWDAFVRDHPQATFFHLSGWRRAIERAYGFRAVYLEARRGGEIVGVLPLIEARSLLFGRRFVSTAFTVGGGVLAHDDEARTALLDAALDEARRAGARYVELRGGAAPAPGWVAREGVYAGFEQPLPASEEENWRLIPRRRRAEVRKARAALAAGVLTCETTSDADLFHRLYARAMRDHGTPVFPRRFAQALIAEFADETEILIVRAAGEPVLALLSFYFRDRAMPYYFGAAPSAREQRAFDLAIWMQMRRAASRGAVVFDFGRSRVGTGSFAYKTFWGFEPRPLVYRYGLVRARAAPDHHPGNPRFAAAASLWRRLPPPLAAAAGPILAPHFP